MENKKKIIFIVVAIIVVILGGILVWSFVRDREKISNLKNQTKIVYNDKIHFSIAENKFMYENKDTGVGASIPFGNKAQYLAVERACDAKEKYQVYVLTTDGQLFINKYPSFKTVDKKLGMETNFLFVITDKKIVGLEEVRREKKECTSSEVYAILENNEKRKVKIEYGNTAYSDKSKLAIAAFLDENAQK